MKQQLVALPHIQVEEEHSCSASVSNNVKKNHISTKWITFITDVYVLFWRCYPID